MTLIGRTFTASNEDFPFRGIPSLEDTEVIKGKITQVIEQYNETTYVVTINGQKDKTFNIRSLNFTYTFDKVLPGDFVEVTKKIENKEYYYYGTVGITRNRIALRNGMTVPESNIKVLVPELYYEKKLNQERSPLILDAIGSEYEASRRKIEKVKDLCPEYVNASSRESQKIFEIQSKPLPINSFSHFIDTYSKIAEIDNFEYSKGEYTEFASSMHVHLSSNLNSELLLKKSNWVPLLAPFLFSKKYYSFAFRTRSISNSDSSRAKLERTNIYNYSSKGAAVTLNGCIPETTIEYRINENPFPLWVYLVPTLTDIDDLFLEDYDTFMENYRKTYNARGCEGYDYYTEIQKTLAIKTLKRVLSFKKEVLLYWKDKVEDFPYFKKVMGIYFKEKFNAQKTLELIKEL